jgi:hypothetical protein
VVDQVEEPGRFRRDLHLGHQIRARPRLR